MIVQIKLKDSMMVITKVNEILFCEDKNSELVIIHNGNDKIKFPVHDIESMRVTK